MIPLAAAGLCLALAASAVWLWQTLSEKRFEAHARLAAGDTTADLDAHDDRQPAATAIEDELLSPEVLSAAVDLLHERGFTLALTSPFDSEVDYLLERLHASPAEQGAPEGVDLSCTSADGDEALQMLTALVDAFIASARNDPTSTTAAPATDWETERRELAAAIERQTGAIAELVNQLEKARAAAVVESAAEGLPSLEDQLALARGAAAEAAELVDGARRDLAANVPAEMVAARLSDGPLRTTIVERLSVERIRDDLRRHEALLVKSASVYGRNHPRMAELREKTEQLRRQVTGFPAPAPDAAESAGKPVATNLVMGALEAELAARQSREDEIAARLAARNLRLDARQMLETQLGEARQELAFLHGEHDRVRREIERTRHEEARRLPAVVEQPVLSPDPIAPNAGLQMAVSCVAGMSLYLLLLWQFRSAREAAAVANPVSRHAPEPPATHRRRARFRSEEERRLARLTMRTSALPSRM
jgi:hypothetical protein